MTVRPLLLHGTGNGRALNLFGSCGRRVSCNPAGGQIYGPFRSIHPATSTPIKSTPFVNVVPGNTDILRSPMGIVTNRTQIHTPSSHNRKASNTELFAAVSLIEPLHSFGTSTTSTSQSRTYRSNIAVNMFSTNRDADPDAYRCTEPR